MKCLHFISIKYFSLSSQKIINVLTFQSRRPPGCSTRWGRRSSGRCAAAGEMSTRSRVRRQRTNAWHWSVNNNEHEPLLSSDSLWWQDMHSGGAMGSNAASARLSSESNENSVRNWERESERCYRKRGDNFPKLPRQSHWRTSAKVSQIKQSQSNP